MNTTFKIALLLMSLAMFGCTDSGPVAPPENADPAPAEGAESADAPGLGAPEGGDDAPEGDGN